MNHQPGANNVAALSFILGGAQYLLAEKLTAMAWKAPVYHYGQNYISDLGVPRCGTLADGRDICSPLHNVMNTGFAVEGILFFIACLLLHKAFSRSGRRLFLLTALLHGVGGLIIALFHSGSGESGLTIHQAGAVMAIGGGNLCLITAGWLMRKLKGWSHYGLLSMVLGCLGLVSMVMIPLNLFSVGIIERASVYTITFWQILTGILLLGRNPPIRRAV